MQNHIVRVHLAHSDEVRGGQRSIITINRITSARMRAPGETPL